MNLSEKNLLKILTELKEKYFASGIKIEFETEVTTFSEASVLKNFSDKAGLNFTVKIGGAEAVTDMYEAKKIGVKTLVAPMIESSYALKKYINSAKTVFNEIPPEFFINIETITGYKNLDEILKTSETKYLSGIVLGRFDMAS